MPNDQNHREYTYVCRGTQQNCVFLFCLTSRRLFLDHNFLLTICSDITKIIITHVILFVGIFIQTKNKQHTLLFFRAIIRSKKQIIEVSG